MKIVSWFMSNASKPRVGVVGRIFLKMMNFAHESLSRWCFDECIHLNGDEDILDIGCGGGRNIERFLLHTRGRVCGVDYSLASVKASIQRNIEAVSSGRSEILVSGVSKLPFEDESFCMVSAFETVYFWPDMLNDFKQIYRVLRKGGEFLICNAVSESKGNELWLNHIDMKIYSEEELRGFMTEAGFSDIRCFRRKEALCLIGKKA